MLSAGGVEALDVIEDIGTGFVAGAVNWPSRSATLRPLSTVSRFAANAAPAVTGLIFVVIGAPGTWSP